MSTKWTYLFLLLKMKLKHLLYSVFLLKSYLLFTHQEPISYINHNSSHFLTEVVNKIFTYFYADWVAQ